MCTQTRPNPFLSSQRAASCCVTDNGQDCAAPTPKGGEAIRNDRGIWLRSSAHGVAAPQSMISLRMLNGDRGSINVRLRPLLLSPYPEVTVARQYAFCICNTLRRTDAPRGLDEGGIAGRKSWGLMSATVLTENIGHSLGCGGICPLKNRWDIYGK